MPKVSPNGPLSAMVMQVSMYRMTFLGLLPETWFGLGASSPRANSKRMKSSFLKCVVLTPDLAYSRDWELSTKGICDLARLPITMSLAVVYRFRARCSGRIRCSDEGRLPVGYFLTSGPSAV